jgi:2-dehydropantoate 2-reductase
VRFVVYGAGAIGGLVGVRLHQGGHEVILVARGRHIEAIRTNGLRIESPDGSEVLRIPATDDPRAIGLGPDDVVLLAMKSQDTESALRVLSSCAAPTLPIFCAQNGVDNERRALRRFGHIYGVCVVCPAGHFEPGVVHTYSSPTTGILDVGRYPAGVDQMAETVAEAFRASTFASEARPDIMRWKYAKLLTNLTTAIEAACGPAARLGIFADIVTREAEACLRAAGIDHASAEEDAERRGDLLHMGPVGGLARPGGSAWQSLHRGTGAIETDYINGEIAMLGRMYGLPTPANELIQGLVNEMARSRTPPGTISPDELLAQMPS